MRDVKTKHGCGYFIFGFDGDCKARFFFVDVHFDTEVVISSAIFGVKVEFEDVAVLLLGGGHGEHVPHLEELFDVLLGYRVLVYYLEADCAAELGNKYDYWSCYQMPQNYQLVRANPSYKLSAQMLSMASLVSPFFSSSQSFKGLSEASSPSLTSGSISPSSLFLMATKNSQGLVYFPSFFLKMIPKLLKSSSKAASGSSYLYFAISDQKDEKLFFTSSGLFWRARQQKEAWSMREMEDLSDWKISLKIAERILQVSTGLLRKV